MLYFLPKELVGANNFDLCMAEHFDVIATHMPLGHPPPLPAKIFFSFDAFSYSCELGIYVILKVLVFFGLQNMRPPIPGDCPPAMKALIELCWALQPEKRPEFWQIVKVLEQFESSVAHDGTLNPVQKSMLQDHKKGLHHWIQKLGPVHQNALLHQTASSMPMPKPKFA